MEQMAAHTYDHIIHSMSWTGTSDCQGHGHNWYKTLANHTSLDSPATVEHRVHMHIKDFITCTGTLPLLSFLLP